MDIFELKARIELLKREIAELKKELKDQQKMYKELEKRYISQNNELCQYKVIVSKEGYLDNTRSK